MLVHTNIVSENFNQRIKSVLNFSSDLWAMSMRSRKHWWWRFSRIHYNYRPMRKGMLFEVLHPHIFIVHGFMFGIGIFSHFGCHTQVNSVTW